MTTIDVHPEDHLAWRGAFMFYLSLVFLALLAAMLVLWIDIPRVHETNDLSAADETTALITVVSQNEIDFEQAAFEWGKRCGFGLVILWPLFCIEQCVNFWQSKPKTAFLSKHPYWWVFCLVPPLRLCAHTRNSAVQVWLPGLEWQVVDRRLRRRLEHLFSIPMIWIALLILPVLGLQFVYKDDIVNHPNLRLLLHFGTGVIWFAFAVEFIVMVSVAESKIAYCKKHWLDLVIILLPLISFLRSLRLLRATKLVKVGKLQQLTRVVRVYRLRGVAMRALRALMLLEVAHRLLRTKPETRLQKLERKVIEKQLELEDLHEQIANLKERYSLRHDSEPSD